MKKKNILIAGIVIIAILIIFGIITGYIDKNKVASNNEPKFCIKFVNSDGNKVTYWGLGYKVVRYVGVSPSEPYESNIGAKFGNWFMEYELLIIDEENNKQEITSSTPDNLVRTYNILNIASSDDENFIYLTIRQFQVDDVETVKVLKELCPDIATGKNYEFTLRPNNAIEDNILSIFENSDVVSIVETDKVGLEQTQDSIF